MTQSDYLIVGTGLSALSFAALMANAGKKVQLIEAHEFPGGYGHSFTLANKYVFNAQLHYVWDCGHNQPVNLFLRKLGLEDIVKFELFDANGYDRMHAPGYSLEIPYDYDLLIQRITKLFPKHSVTLGKFIRTVQATGEAIDYYGAASRRGALTERTKGFFGLIKFVNSTLQDVFDAFALPLEAQTLLALQWPCFMLPPNKVSFIAWVGLVHGYHKGAYFATGKYQQFVDTLVDQIQTNGGEIQYGRTVIEYIRSGKTIEGVISQDSNSHGDTAEHRAQTVICNADPRRAAEMIGLENFSRPVKRRLNYEYSPSNFMAYCAVKDLDLTKHGFGKSILYHTSEMDLNKSYDKMYYRGDYSAPSFAISTPSLHSGLSDSCPDDTQLIEFITVADYQRFLNLKVTSRRNYRAKKKEILNSILDVVEENYIPELREHLVFSSTGSPTTNERYCLSPRGNSYGSNLTPTNIGLNRLDERTSLENFYFCNASAGFAGFAGTIATGTRLYELQTGDKVL